MTAQNSHARTDLSRGAIAGTLIFLLIFFLFWATAAAESLPADAPDLLRGYTPAHGVQSLVNGLFWTGLFGAVLGACLFGLYGLARRLGRHGEA